MPACGAVVFDLVEAVSKLHAAFHSPAQWFGIRVPNRFQNNDIGTFGISCGVLASYAFAKVIFWTHRILPPEIAFV